MVIHTGVDIVEVSRIKNSISNSGKHFIERVYTKSEAAYCVSAVNSFERFAARFAAKEAFVKAIGKGFSDGIMFNMIEVAKRETGEPYLVLHDKALEAAEKLGIESMDISLSHIKETAIATVVILSKN
ncbi:MAG: holo-[acyl-carrier-protein] synthase [Ruminococcaceae bacterium]|nr:holo-[acyl-carrier-protein] synthase [Oscillospiraceae bacterium]